MRSRSSSWLTDWMTDWCCSSSAFTWVDFYNSQIFQREETQWDATALAGRADCPESLTPSDKAQMCRRNKAICLKYSHCVCILLINSCFVIISFKLEVLIIDGWASGLLSVLCLNIIYFSLLNLKHHCSSQLLLLVASRQTSYPHSTNKNKKHSSKLHKNIFCGNPLQPIQRLERDKHKRKEQTDNQTERPCGHGWAVHECFLDK